MGTTSMSEVVGTGLIRKSCTGNGRRLISTFGLGFRVLGFSWGCKRCHWVGEGLHFYRWLRLLDHSSYTTIEPAQIMRSKILESRVQALGLRMKLSLYGNCRKSGSPNPTAA